MEELKLQLEELERKIDGKERINHNKRKINFKQIKEAIIKYASFIPEISFSIHTELDLDDEYHFLKNTYYEIISKLDEFVLYKEKEDSKKRLYKEERNKKIDY